MDDLRAAIDRALALTPATRLIAIDAAGLVAAGERAVFAACTRDATRDARGVVADPFRLPFTEAVADRVVARFDRRPEPKARLREIWRILAPAGTAVIVVRLPAIHHRSALILNCLTRRRWQRWLIEAMFDPGGWDRVGGALIVSATKRDGLSPPPLIAAAALHPARA